jgi:hypothetical protein
MRNVIVFRQLVRPGTVAAAICLGAAVSAAACDSGARDRIEPTYDGHTGRLRLLKYDSNGNGKVDTWSYMDGTRVLRIEIDRDEDGAIDRWEYYGEEQTLEKVGYSRANDGKEDAWAYLKPDGSISRIELSSHRNGKINRTEYFEKGQIVRASEDTDDDGQIDKWEEYIAGRMTSVAFDTTHRGTPDRRLVYGADGRPVTEGKPSDHDERIGARRGH